MATTKIYKGTHFGNVSSSTKANTKKTLKEKSERPLAPTNLSAVANGTGNSTKITLECTIYVSESNMPKKNGNENDYAKEIDFQISYSVDNNDKVTIYVSRDNSFISSSTFYAYVVPIGFSPSDIPRLGDNFTTVEIINWDEDPDGSRGTETTVQRPSY
ncbi:hypothetical protein CXF68_07760 [Tenacibaculum sp. Bg11-29]|uniref:hypothetical protein n=1 Tax=Tenacibaculum sp. Bg11-29 TaxID=2058306 RepID=UPI000C349D44|nr:hypothetical protein [Tenacibaculum sp. Bg11-29]PKH50597.1 hypothetical protein CXF68_07760 [Tenacibaculum sp. Bg11-29]